MGRAILAPDDFQSRRHQAELARLDVAVRSGTQRDAELPSLLALSAAGSVHRRLSGQPWRWGA